MYSQYEEEKYIGEVFGDFVGRFLDIGAYDGKTFSNTYRLVELGWGGVCVEPSISILSNLKALHKGNDKIEILEYAIGSESKKVLFHDSLGDAVSSCNRQHMEKWKSGGSKFQEIKVNCLSVNSLFEKVGYDFDFINIDVEGDSVELFLRLPFDMLIRVECYCVEYDNELKRVLNIAEEIGFNVLSTIHGNAILRRAQT